MEDFLSKVATQVPSLAVFAFTMWKVTEHLAKVLDRMSDSLNRNSRALGRILQAHGIPEDDFDDEHRSVG